MTWSSCLSTLKYAAKNIFFWSFHINFSYRLRVFCWFLSNPIALPYKYFITTHSVTLLPCVCMCVFVVSDLTHEKVISNLVRRFYLCLYPWNLSFLSFRPTLASHHIAHRRRRGNERKRTKHDCFRAEG